jgi:hypothetical protein
MAQNIPTDHKTYQHFPFPGPPKFPQIGIFGLKIYHLATLVHSCSAEASPPDALKLGFGIAAGLPDFS